MKRLVFGLIIAIAMVFIGGVTPTLAAASAPACDGDHGTGGQVTGVSGTTITVSTRGGTASIATTSTTTLVVDGASASLADLKAGMFVRAEGTRAADGSFTATRVVASTSAPVRPNRPRA